MSPTDFYKGYLADDSLSELSMKLISHIRNFHPAHVLDFGCGTGKHIALLNESGICTHGIDLSMQNVVVAIAKHNLPSVAIGNESHLRHYCNFDIVTTCSVLDHIEQIDDIITEFKRIANKAIVIAETNDVPGKFYYPHNYEALGFEKTLYEWKSTGDGATYNIWIWDRSKQLQETKGGVQ